VSPPPASGKFVHILRHIANRSLFYPGGDTLHGRSAPNLTTGTGPIRGVVYGIAAHGSSFLWSGVNGFASCLVSGVLANDIPTYSVNPNSEVLAMAFDKATSAAGLVSFWSKGNGVGMSLSSSA